MPLIITSGYGSSQKIATSGYGSGSSVASNLFLLDSAELPSPNVLRARFTRTPNTTTGANSTRGNIIANWTITGPNGNVPIQVASTYINDSEVIDLTLFTDIVPGDYTLTVAATVLSSDLFVLSNTSVPFTLTEVFEEPISQGALATTSFLSDPLADPENDFSVCYDGVNKLFNPAYRNKDGWSQLIASIAKGDCNVSQQAKDSYDQFFVSTAVGKYLTVRGHDYNIARPSKTGMDDDPYRRLVISTSAQKLTQTSFLESLKIFYGLDSVQAFAKTGNVEPYTIDHGQTLSILIDEKTQVNIVFNRQDFQTIRRAKAIEVASVINRAMELHEANGFAVTEKDPITGDVAVKIYSGTMGLGSIIRITGGTAQIPLQLPENRFPKPSPLPPLPTWSVTSMPDGKCRLSVNSSTIYDISKVQVGDYVVVNGLEFNPDNRGSFQVTNVYYTYSTKWIEIENSSAFSQPSVVQTDYESVNVFQSRKLTPYDYHRYVTVSQMGGIAKISIPVTTLIVSRKKYEGAYLNVNTPIPFSALSRNPDGSTTITLNNDANSDTVPDMAPGDVFTIDGFVPQATLPPSTFNASSVAYSAYNEASGIGYVSSVSRLSFGFTYQGVDATVVKDPDVVDPSIWFVGGHTLDAGGTKTAKDSIDVFDVTAETENQSLQKTHKYKWFKGTLPPQHNIGATVAFPPVGNPQYGKPYIAGGYNNTPWGGTTASPALVSALSQATRIKPSQVLLSAVQFRVSAPLDILAAIPVWFTTNPSSGHLLTVSDGVTTRTYGFGVGGDVTVTIGGSAFATMANLATAINGDGGAAWGAEYATNFSTAEFPVANAVVIYEDAFLSAKSGLRVYGNVGFAAIASTVNYANDLVTNYDYSNSVAVSLPSANPGGGRAGFHRGISTVSVDETHEVLNGVGNIFRRWTGVAWSSTINWVSATAAGGSLGTPVAEAASVYLRANLGDTSGSMMVTGGVTIQNKATTLIQQGPTVWTNYNMKHARCGHSIIKISETQALIIGGRQPANDVRRSSLGYASNWNFEDAHGAVQYAGPVNVTVNGNLRVAGKIGFGTTLTNPSISIGGANQATLNTQLLAGTWTISGWMTSGTGCVLRNGKSPTTIVNADNTLISFGVDPADDKFFIRWAYGAGLNITKKTTQTRSQLMPLVGISGYPKYYHFAITKEPSSPTTSAFKLYINGVIAGTWSDVSPDGGSAGRWAFGEADDGDFTVAPYTGKIDSIGVTSTLLNASNVYNQYIDEVGVFHEQPNTNYSAVGTVLNSCELLNKSSNSVVVGSMTTGRFAAGVVQLPDGRVLVAGGVGFNPTNEYKQPLSQRQCELRSAELYDPSTRLWTPIADMAEPHSYCAIGLNKAKTRVYIMGGFSSRKVEYLDLRTMRWSISRGSYDNWDGSASVKEKAHSGGGVLGDTIVLGGGCFANNTGVYETEARHFSSSMAAEHISAGGINGEHVVKSSTPTSITFDTPNQKFWTTTALAGGTVTPAKAATSDIGMAGPFVYDPQGITITDKVATMNQRLEVGHQYSLVNVGTNEASEFPSFAGGWVVFNFGRSKQTQPIKYLGKISNSTIIIDNNAVFNELVEIGDSVRFVDKNPFVPDDSSEIGAFWLTASSSGRIAAIKNIKDISAFGIELDITTRYPGDRGLGGQGLPVKHNYKLSDIVSLFGGDDLDTELEDARDAS